MKQQRFLRLLLAAGDHPVAALSQEQYDALPERCRQALNTVTLDTRLDPPTRKTLEAYYAAGYRPHQMPGAGPWWYQEDIAHSQELSTLPGGFSELIRHSPRLADSRLEDVVRSFLERPELPAGEKIRLEAVRLVLQLKGQLQPAESGTNQATQIVIHTASEPTVKTDPKAPQRIDIDL